MNTFVFCHQTKKDKMGAECSTHLELKNEKKSTQFKPGNLTDGNMKAHVGTLRFEQDRIRSRFHSYKLSDSVKREKKFATS
jgi:hypothetical protein